MEKPSTSSQSVSQERHIKKDQDQFWHLIRILDKNHGSLMLPVQQWWTDLADGVLFLPTGKVQGYNGVGGSMAALELPENQSVNSK